MSGLTSSSSQPTILGQEPAVILGFVSAVVGLLVTLKLGLSDNWAVGITSAVSGVLSLIVGLMTRPVTPAVFTAFVAVTADVAARFGYHVAPETVGAVNAIIMTLFMFHVRAHVTPVSTINSMYVSQPVNKSKING